MKNTKNKKWSTFRTEKYSHDRWSGVRLLERKEFKSKAEALRYCKKINSKNTLPSAPEYYETATLLD